MTQTFVLSDSNGVHQYGPPRARYCAFVAAGHNRSVSRIKTGLPAPNGASAKRVQTFLRKWGRRRGLLGPWRSVHPAVTLRATWPSRGWTKGLASSPATNGSPVQSPPRRVAPLCPDMEKSEWLFPYAAAAFYADG
eukprot:2615301-Pleurochrysis_carterae.AAC.3